MRDGASSDSKGSETAVRIQRIENGLIAVAIVIAVVSSDLTWWVLLATFLVFDLSALGYLHGDRVGAAGYNVVHNYAGPAVAIAVYAVLRSRDIDADWLVLLAASWGFHVAVDRVLGYGLKLGAFQDTHLGRIGRRH